MNEEEIRDEARKAANRSQFMSNHIYDHKSYEDGFYEGMNQALRQYGVMQRSEQLCGFFEADNKTSSATKCKCGREKWEHPHEEWLKSMVEWSLQKADSICR